MDLTPNLSIPIPDTDPGNLIPQLRAEALAIDAAIGWGIIYFNARQFGAIGDGVANDTASIQAAINAAVTIGTGGVYLPDGTYKITSTLVLGDNVTNNFTGVSLIGSNGLVGTTLNWAGSTSGTAIQVWRGRYNHLRDFKLISTVARGTTKGIQFTGNTTGTNTHGVQVSRVDVEEFHYGGYIGDGTGKDASEITFLAGAFVSNDIGLRIDGANSLNINTYNTGFDSNTTYGIDCDSGYVNVFGGAFGRNGKDIKQTNAGTVTMIGVRTESKEIFDSSSSGVTSHSNLINISQAIVDDFTVTAATNASPIAVTTGAAHGFSTGDRVFIRNAGGAGNTAVGGPWTITVTGGSTFTLNGSTGNGAYTGGAVGIKDWNPIKLRSGSVATVDGCSLRGSVYVNNGSGGVSVSVRNCDTVFLSPLDVTDGNGNNAYYTFDHTRIVDESRIVLSNLNEAGRVVSTALVPSGNTFTSAIQLPTQTGSAIFGIDESSGTLLTIANNATATPFSNANNFSGLILLTDTNLTGTTGVFIVGGSSAVALVSQTGTLYSVTSGTAGKVNVYPNAGVVTIENKQGSSIQLSVFSIRTRNSG